MNLKKLTTLLFAGVTAATPFATNAQNPTILQGNYVSNVFGQANFVLNPNAQTNVANVTVTNATRTRSTTTPLVATTEFNVTVTSANGTITWATRSFDAGMKNQNCEARFTYRGFQATSKAQIKQGANVVAELTLTPSASDPRIASINFPCGDLSAASTFVITDSATLSGTNEIGGIYVGLATNMANVAQAEAVVRATRSTSFSVPNNSETIFPYTTEEFDIYSEYEPTTGVFTAKRAGKYLVTATMMWTINSIAAGEIRYIKLSLNGSSKLIAWEQQQASSNRYVTNQSTTTLNLNVGDTIDVRLYQNSGSAKDTHSDNSYNALSIYRFPLSSELVVTPENQNVWGGVVYTNQKQTIFEGNTPATAFSSFNNSTWNQPTLLKGKAAVTTTNSGNDLGFSIPNLPVGAYKVEISGLLQPLTVNETNTTAECNWKIVETTTSTDVAKQVTEAKMFNVTYNTRDFVNAFSGVFNNTALATRNFRLEANKKADSSTTLGASCQAYSNTGPTGALNTNITFLLTPLDNASNSALYVQGPVKSAGTGAAIPAGYVGEEKLKDISTGSNWPVAGTGNWATLDSIVLDAGVWQCSGSVWVYRNGANFGGPYIDYITHVFSDVANNAPNIGRENNQTSLELAVPNGFSVVELPLKQTIFRSNGSQIIWPDGVARGTTTLYLNSFLYAWSSGTPQFKSRISCIRIN